MSDMTFEPQYQVSVDLKNREGLTPLGIVSNLIWDDDPRRMLFAMARYKFVSKMLSGKQKVLEVGCGDAFFSRIVLQEVKSLCAIDIDEVFIADAKERMKEKWKIDCRLHDILSNPIDGDFDAAYSLDVLEHIPAERENEYMKNIFHSLKEQGVLIVGMPSIQSQAYASPRSKEGHINCKDHKELNSLMQNYFHNVFIFSMNDEVVHTGFYPMAHYLFAIGVGKKTI